MMTMIVLIDNYDSFTYNLWHYLGELDARAVVHRNDRISVDEIEKLGPEAVVISPGPCDPDRAGICLELIERLGGKLPIFGVCLGHQAIGQAFGGRIERSPVPMHGKVSEIEHDGRGVFAGLPSPLRATRYHSLTIAPDSMPDCLEVTAWTDDGVIMGIRHKEFALHGVQFHPESIESEYGHDILKNFLALLPTKAKAA
jgi:anthranilate synthase component 2